MKWFKIQILPYSPNLWRSSVRLSRQQGDKGIIVVSYMAVFLLFGACLLSSPLQARALSVYDFAPRVDAASISAKSVVVMNQQTGEVLYEQGSQEARVPASLVKLTTALVVLDLHPKLERTCELNEPDRIGGVQISKAGQAPLHYSMKQLMHAMLIPSANDAAAALARCTGLSEARLLDLMEAKAGQQGAKFTHFKDASGLSEDNISTAADVAKLANAAFSTAIVRSITHLSSYRLCSQEKFCQTLRSTNKLLGDNELQVVAGKTGTLDGAINFAGSFRDSVGHYFIVVILGGSSKASRFAEAKALVKFATVQSEWSERFAIR